MHLLCVKSREVGYGVRNEVKCDFNKIQFAGLEGIMCGDALHYVEYRARRGRVLKCFLDVFVSSFFTKIQMEKQGKGNIFFLFSNSYAERSDIWSWFIKVCKLSGSRVVIKPSDFKITLSHVKYIKNFFLWWTSCKKIGQLSKIEKLYYLTELYKAAVDVWEIKDWAIKNEVETKLLVVVYDAHLIDSLAVQLYNKLNIDTATLQHGSFSCENGNWAFAGSKSKKFLAYGQCTKEDGEICGLHEERILLMGMPQYVDTKLPMQIQKSNKNKFGVILNGGNLTDENSKLLELAENFAKKRGVRYDIKLHPADQGQNNELLKQLEYSDNIYQKEKNVIQFTEGIDYAIVNKSTVFLDYILNLFPVYIYEIDQESYKGIKWCKVKNVCELEEKVDLLEHDLKKTESEFLKIRDSVCVGGDIKARYQNFFRKYED